MYKYEDDFGRNLLDLKRTNYKEFVDYLYLLMETKDTNGQKECAKRIKRILKQRKVANADIAFIVDRDSSTVDRWQHKYSDVGNTATPAPIDAVAIIADAFDESIDHLVGLDEYYNETNEEEQSPVEANNSDYSSPMERIKSGISDLFNMRRMSPDDINLVIRNIETIFYFPDFILKLSRYMDKFTEITPFTPTDKKLLKTNILKTLDKSPELLKEKLDDILSYNQLSSNMVKEVYIADLIQELKKIL